MNKILYLTKLIFFALLFILVLLLKLLRESIYSIIASIDFIFGLGDGNMNHKIVILLEVIKKLGKKVFFNKI